VGLGQEKHEGFCCISCGDAQDRHQWRLRIKGQQADQGVREGWPLLWHVCFNTFEKYDDILHGNNTCTCCTFIGICHCVFPSTIAKTAFVYIAK